MVCIYKYTLHSDVGRQELLLPIGAILDMQLQGNKITLWVGSEDVTKKTTAIFWLFETGREFELPPTALFLKTVQFDNGRYVIHIFQEK